MVTLSKITHLDDVRDGLPGVTTIGQIHLLMWSRNLRGMIVMVTLPKITHLDYVHMCATACRELQG